MENQMLQVGDRIAVLSADQLRKGKRRAISTHEVIRVTRTCAVVKGLDSILRREARWVADSQWPFFKPTRMVVGLHFSLACSDDERQVNDDKIRLQQIRADSKRHQEEVTKQRMRSLARLQAAFHRHEHVLFDHDKDYVFAWIVLDGRKYMIELPEGAQNS